MSKKLIWAHWLNLDYSTMPYRNSVKDVWGKFEFPVNRYDIDNFLLELDTASIVKKPVFDLTNRVENYEDRLYSTIDQVAEKIFKQAGDKKIALLYSGGIDSVCILAALQRNKKYKEFLDQGKLFLAMTSSSITEYPWLFYNHILGKLPITVLSYDKLMNDPNILLVTGDGGDYISGSSDINTLLNNNHQDLMNDYTELLTDSKKLQTYNELCLQVKDNCPFEIKSVNQFIWWLSQCFAIQTEVIWPYVWSSISDLSSLTNDSKVYRFFYDDAMLTFSYEYMSTNPEYHSYDQTKFWLKKYSVGHFGDADYFNKGKVFSQRRTLRLGYKSQIYIEDNEIKFINTNEKIQ